MRIMLRVIIILLVIILMNQCYSQTLTSGFVTRHSHDGYNDQNTGVGLRLDEGRFSGWSAGYYYNSIRKDSFYLAREWQWQVAGPVHVGVLAGAVTGYQWAVTPLVLPEVVLHVGSAEAAVLLQPVDLGKDFPAFVSLQLRWRFK